MSLPDSILKSNSAIASNLASAIKDAVLDEDEDDYYVSHILCKRAEDSIQAILNNNTSAILKLFKKPVVDSDELQSPDPITFSHSVEVVDTIFVEAESLVCEPVVFGAAIVCSLEVAGGVLFLLQ